MTTRSHALRSTMFSSLGIYSEYFLGMVAAIMTARQLGPKYLGIYALFIWFAGIGVAITNSGITTGVIKFVAELRGSGQEDLIVPLLADFRRVQRWHLLVVLGIGTILFLVAGERFVPDLNYVEFALLIAAVGMRAPYMFNISIAKGFEAFDATAKVAMVAAPLNLMLVGIAMLLHAPIFWFLVVYAISSAIFLLASQFQAKRLIAPLSKKHISLPDELLRRMRRHLRIVSATIIVSYLVASDVEVLYLNLYTNSTSAGYFKVAYQLATGIMLLVPGVFGAVLLPMMAKALSQGREVAGQRFANVTTYLTLLAAPVLAFGTGFSGAVIALLYGSAYAPAAPVLVFCLFCGAISTAAQGASSLLVSADRQHTILTMTIALGVLKFALDITLISRFGLYGAVAAIVIQALIGSVSYVGLGMRISGVGLHWGRLLRIVLAATLSALAAAWLTFELHLVPLLTVLIGGVALSGLYLLLTLLLGCWSRADISQMQELHKRFAAGQPLLLGRLLSWCGTRAGRVS